MPNPFEDDNGEYHVLINAEGQHSLWPSFIQVPDGWKIIHKSDNRSACLQFINTHWTDMRPNSLVDSMKAINTVHGNKSSGRRTKKKGLSSELKQ